MTSAGIAQKSWALLLILIAAGCGGNSSDQPELGQVSGTVTLDGQPLSEAEVTFQPAHARAAFGKTDSSGRYELTYLNDTKGAVVGINQVMITTGRLSPADDGDTSGRVPEKLPKKYHAETTLSADVQPGENQFDFELTSK